MLTIDQLKKVLPRMERNPNSCANLFPHLIKAMEEAHINTPLRIAAFLAQVGHESGEFRYMSELWGPTDAQNRYEPPSTLATRLGNVHPGDGKKYMGRGPIQLTGRANYRACGTALGLDLEGNPDQASTNEQGFRVACWFWTKNGLNALADTGDFDGITHKINGGYNGKAERDAYYAKAKSVLGC